MRRCCLFMSMFVLCFAGSILAATPAESLTKKPDDWFQSDAGRRAMDCILSWQSEHGSWPKNVDTTAETYTGDRAALKGTFDNGATLGELSALARAFNVTGDARYEQAVVKGFDHLLRAQYPNGGWPQYYPLSSSYHRHITFNDGSMIRVMEFLRGTTRSREFAFLGNDRHSAATAAVERGIDCIVKCQIMVDGKPTVWCAQHDEITLAPAKARAYELASLSGSESAGILKFLMSLESPRPEVVAAVNNGMAWFNTVRIDGFRYKRSDRQTNLTADASADPLWARFYEIGTNRPLFCGRDGVAKYDIEQIEAERRGGYTWFGNWGESLANTYAKWPYRVELGQ